MGEVSSKEGLQLMKELVKRQAMERDFTLKAKQAWLNRHNNNQYNMGSPSSMTSSKGPASFSKYIARDNKRKLKIV